MTLRNLGLAAATELILLLLLAGFTVVRSAETIRIPTIQVISITQAGAKLKPTTASEPAPTKTTQSVKPSTKPGVTQSTTRAGAAGTQTGAAPASYPGDRANPSPQSVVAVIYPKEAQNEEWEGVVIVEASIDKNGRPTATRITQSSGHPVLDNSFATSVMKMTFKPKREKGVDVAGKVTLRHHFQLDE